MDGCRRIIPFALVIVIAGCGSGALSGPGGTTADTATATITTGTSEATTAPVHTTTTSPQKKTTATTKRQYGWSLPEGPTSPTTNEDVIYRRLLGKACGEAQQELDRTWSGLMSPRNAPLYQAAVDLCGGRTSGARSMYGKAAALGLQMHQGAGGSAAVDCAILRAVRSVLDQIAQESVRCTPGTPPRWPTEDSFAKDDPRTDVVEGTTTTTTTTTTASSSSSSSSSS
ncbi:hypothetical protein SAMN04488074_104289 [Lentzea albidocapillata subsp. violacea]|uniref:DUF732 domain-containing protein n=2 Tax=Lentzea albidocapillata TaxID=40571 RepID=A0A1G8Z9R1_9PSEU|nr:hypothetical protein SAMN04488074_104289 [Lentzea albidocapillata subsp. violacea]